MNSVTLKVVSIWQDFSVPYEKRKQTEGPIISFLKYQRYFEKGYMIVCFCLFVCLSVSESS